MNKNMKKSHHSIDTPEYLQRPTMNPPTGMEGVEQFQDDGFIHRKGRHRRQGMLIYPEKTEAVKNIPPPTDGKSINAFLHMAQFNLEFLHPVDLDGKPSAGGTKAINYQELVAPLRALDKRGVVWLWTEECIQCNQRTDGCWKSSC